MILELLDVKKPWKNRIKTILLFDKLLQLKEGLERSEKAKEVIETRKKFSKNKKYIHTNIKPHQITNHKQKSTLKIHGIPVENPIQATKPLT